MPHNSFWKSAGTDLIKMTWADNFSSIGNILEDSADSSFPWADKGLSQTSLNVFHRVIHVFSLWVIGERAKHYIPAHDE